MAFYEDACGGWLLRKAVGYGKADYTAANDLEFSIVLEIACICVGS